MDETAMKSRCGPERGVTLIELLVVISIIAFLAGALVVASQRMRYQAQLHGTNALVQKIMTANERFYNDYRYYAPDSAIGKLGDITWLFGTSPGLPSTIETSEINTDAPGMPGDKMPTTGNECMTITLALGNPQYMTVTQEYLSGPRRTINTHPTAQGRTSRCIIVDSWGLPLFYDCHRPEGKRYIDEACWHNTQAFDVFSLGPDGRTAARNNKIDDDGDGDVDESDEAGKQGEAIDDINNWRGTSRK